MKIKTIGLEAIIPVYGEDGGNYTKVLYAQEETIHQRRIETVLKELCSSYVVDYKGAKLYYGELIGRRNGVSIPLSKDLTLVPFKLRKPIGRKDGGYGFIRYESIEETREASIRLLSGRTLDTLESRQIIRVRMRTALTIKSMGRIMYNDPGVLIL